MRFNLSIPLFFLFLFVLASCKKEVDYYYDPENPLTLSYDTVKFDTVFTSVGSVSTRVKIFNRSKNDVTVSEIELAGGDNSFYQINVNGIAANKVSNFKIRGLDSINLFVRVNIDPNAETTPFIISDSVLFNTNGKQQKLQLEAYGQNARWLKNGATISTNTVWDKTLPYVVYNSLKVAEGVTLTMQKGTRVYFHKGANLEIAGTLKIQGDLNDSVTLASDRTEWIYREVPGQWDGIHLLKSSKDNVIEYATIKNGLIGIQTDSAAANSNPRLLLVNSIIKNMEIVGLLGYKTSITAFNNLILHCGKHLVYCTNGGDYNFKHNTFVNYFKYSARTTPSLFFSDFVSNSTTAPCKVSLVNNIIWGNNSDELYLEKKGSAFDQTVKTNLIRTKDAGFKTANIVNSDPLFLYNGKIDYGKYNFSLLSGSPAANAGENLSSDPFFQSWLAKDALGKVRIFPCELGCYEIF